MKTGIIGCGQISDTHIPFIKSHSSNPEIAIADSNEFMLAKAGDKYGITQRFSSADALLQDFCPDVVHILTPPQTHFELCMKFMKAGCHIFLEKPMCMDSKEAHALAAEAKVQGLILCVDHNHRFDPYMLKAKKLFESGAIGDLCSIESYYGFDLGTNPGSRYFREAYTHWAYRMPGGLFQNLIDHPLYQALDYMDSPSSIEAFSHEKGIMPGGVPDELRIFMRDEKCTAHITVSLAVSPRAHYFKLAGTKGTIFVDFVNQYTFLYKHSKGPKAISRALMNITSGLLLIFSTVTQVFKVIAGRFTTYPGTEIIIHQMYDAILNGTKPPVSLDQAVKVLEISDIVWDKISYPKF